MTKAQALTHTLKRVVNASLTPFTKEALLQYIEYKVLLNPIYPRSIYWIYIQFVENESSCVVVSGLVYEALCERLHIERQFFGERAKFGGERSRIYIAAKVALCVGGWLALFVSIFRSSVWAEDGFSIPLKQFHNTRPTFQSRFHCKQLKGYWLLRGEELGSLMESGKLNSFSWCFRYLYGSCFCSADSLKLQYRHRGQKRWLSGENICILCKWLNLGRISVVEESLLLSAHGIRKGTQNVWFAAIWKDSGGDGPSVTSCVRATYVRVRKWFCSHEVLKFLHGD